MESKIIYTKTEHKRYGKTPHHFSYSLPYILTRLSDLDALGKRINLFSYNKKNLYSICDTDYLGKENTSIVEKFKSLPSTDPFNINNVWLLTTPRFLGYAFNPVSFYLIYDNNQMLTNVVVEVTNTYHDKHLYFLKNDRSKRFLRRVEKKTFHVSPFLTEKGDYHFSFSRDLSKLEIHITYRENGIVKFYANLIQKEVLKMSDLALIKTTALYPGSAFRTLPRILFQAFKLSFFKGVEHRKRPIPTHPNTISKKPPTFIESFFMKVVIKIFREFKTETLILKLPNNETLCFGSGNGKQACIVINDYAFFKTVVLNGEIGFGEAYTNKLWESPNLQEVFHVLLKNISEIKSRLNGNLAFHLFNSLRHFKQRNSVSQTKKNIFYHYDIGNAFYKLFLDDEMNYSSALYKTSTDTLEQAQIQKLDRLFDYLHIDSTHSILEIGSGWGAAAIRLVQKTGCHVTTLTVSEAQYQSVQEKILALKLDDKITVRLEDYRQHQGQYDRILSIEMIEAVGHDYLPDYFKTLDRLLKPNGIVAIQAIIVPDQRYETYRKESDWIKKHIFPGGHMPSLHHIQTILANDTSLIIEDIKNIGSSYARTLEEWRKRFLDNLETVKEQGFDQEFILKWIYYLSSCEAAFSARYINAIQLVLTRPLNTSLGTIKNTRETHE